MRAGFVLILQDSVSWRSVSAPWAALDARYEFNPVARLLVVAIRTRARPIRESEGSQPSTLRGVLTNVS